MSNGTNLTQEILDNYNTVNVAAVEWEGWISLGLAVAQIPLLAWIELGRVCHHPKVQVKLAISWLNIYITSISFANCLSNVFYNISTNLEDPGPQLFFNNLADLALVALYTALFLYSATRGTPIFKSLFPRGVKWIPVYNYMFLLVQLSQAGLFIAVFCLSLDTACDISSLGEKIGVSAVFLLEVFEIFVSFCYCTYLWKMSKASVLVQDMEISLMIISKIGIISNIFGLFWFISFLFIYAYSWSESTSYFENAMEIFVSAYMSLFPNFYAILQLWMKYSLRRQEWAEKDDHQRRIDTGKTGATTAQDPASKVSMKRSSKLFLGSKTGSDKA